MKISLWNYQRRNCLTKASFLWRDTYYHTRRCSAIHSNYTLQGFQQGYNFHQCEITHPKFHLVRKAEVTSVFKGQEIYPVNWSFLFAKIFEDFIVFMRMSLRIENFQMESRVSLSKYLYLELLNINKMPWIVLKRQTKA